jgi:hypothetical protein
VKKIPWVYILIVANLVAISWAVIHFLNLTYPMVGHDYGLTIPGMLDIFLHYHVNGMSIQWYTPTFGGGVPAFPDPNNGQFSLLALLPLLVNPWQSVIVSSIFYIAVGGIACYYLFNRVLKLNWTSSILGMIFFLANGFLMQRIAVGHLGYQTFPVIAILVITLVDTSIPKAISGLIFSLVVAMLIYFAGYFLIVVFGLTILIILPMVYIYRPSLFSWKRILCVLSIGGFVSLVISASKLAAVYGFMRFFPRQMADSYPTTGILKGLLGVGFQLLGTMNLAPLLRLVGLDPALLQNFMISITGAQYGYWEFDMSMSPIVFGIIISAVYSFFRTRKDYKKTFLAEKKWIAWILLILFTWLAIEFTLAKGLVYPLLQKLPILSSLHVNPRFASAFLFPLALTATIIYDRWASKWSSRKSILIFISMNLLTLFPLSMYFMINPDLQNRSYDITASQEIYNLIRSGNNLIVTGIVSGAGNTDALILHQSNLQPYWPIFGYHLENFHPEIVPGSIWDVSNGYYNMTNPAGYVFPELNGTRLFERIPVDEKDQLEAFASHKQQPGWKIPIYQQVVDWVSGLTVLVVVIAVAVVGSKSLVAHFNHHKKPIRPIPGGGNVSVNSRPME